MTIKPTTGFNVLQRSVVLRLECHWLGNFRHVDTQEVINAAAGEEAGGQQSVDASQVSSTIRLIDQKELRPVHRLFGQAKQYLRSRAVPSNHALGAGTYLVPFPAVEDADVALEGFDQRIRSESAALAVRYEAAVERQRLALGPKLFQAKHYLKPTEVAQRFWLDWSYLSFAAPDKLEEVSRAVYARTVTRYDRQIGDAAQEARLIMREEARAFVADVLEKLQPDPDGSPKVLRQARLDRLTGYLASAGFRDLTDDAELQAMVQQLRDITSGLDVAVLKDNASLRGHVAAQLQQASAALDELVAGGRQVSLRPLAAMAP